ncbi:hypothetical protein [Cetobacterium sp.]|uniref:hypothetical protein n=1 Tax=Cetobacterium sp. TaxID=2071632 RepID=UPI003EE76E79
MNFIERMEKIIKEKSILSLKEKIVIQELKALDESYEPKIFQTYDDNEEIVITKAILKKDKYSDVVATILLKNEKLEVKLRGNTYKKLKFKDFKKVPQIISDYENGYIFIDDEDNIHVSNEIKNKFKIKLSLVDELEKMLNDKKIEFYKHEYNHQSKEQSYNIGFDKLIIKNGDTLIIETEDRQRKEVPTDDIYILPSLFSEV